MKTNLRRLCALFPWLDKSRPEIRSQRGSQMATELRGLGDLGCYARTDISEISELTYTSLRDIMATQLKKRNNMNFLEIEESGFWLNDDNNRTPKSRLLEKAAYAWLQPIEMNRKHQQGNLFLRYWLKFTNQAPVATAPVIAPPQNFFRFTFAECVGYCPILKWFDLSFAFSFVVERLRQPQAFAFLRAGESS